MSIPLSLPPPPSPNKPPLSPTDSPTPKTLIFTPKPNSSPNPSELLLHKCTSLSQFKQIHAQMIRKGLAFSPLPASHLVSFCTSHDFVSLDYARLIFSQIHCPTTFTSNSIIRAYTNRNISKNSILFYIELVENGYFSDNFTFPSLFKSCRELKLGRELHCHAVKLGFGEDVYVQNTLMNMYSECGSLDCACKVFDKMGEKTVVSWATMIAAYTKWDDPDGGLEVYRTMIRENVEPNEIVLVNTLTACARARDLEMAKGVHRYVERRQIGFNLVLWASLLDVYCKCGHTPLARKLFDEMPEKNLFCWNIMIKGHVEDSDYKEALHLFREMQFRGIRGDQITMASLVLACAHLGALELGKWLHMYIKRENIEVDVVLGTVIVDMYAKCGCIESAFKVFDDMPSKDLMTWTALIAGLATSGHGERALEVFAKMVTSGMKPDAITFVGVLTACSHAGLVDKGQFYFDSMSKLYNIDPTVEHYGCMVDLFGRAGLIDKAEELVGNMPMAPDYFVLGSLLSACRVHKNLKVAERTARRILELDSKNGGTYVLLSNIHASLENWGELNRIRELMIAKNIRKPPGCSMIEVGGEVHEFVMGDASHPRSTEIYAMIDDMMCKLKAEGYVPNKSQVLINMDEEEKENALCRHSEKLAVAFGLISTSPGAPIRVIKNLRVCSDCHAANKLIAKIYGREIVVRDRFRFHHFKDGECSCKDFW